MRSISKTADHAMDEVKETAAQARGSLVDFGTQALKFLNQLRVMEMRGADAVLHRVGLQRRESSLMPAVWFAAGGVTVGLVALAFAPEAGKDLRARISRLFDDGVDKAKDEMMKAKDTVDKGVEKAKEVGRDAESKVEQAIGDAKRTVGSVAHTAEKTATDVMQRTENKIGNGIDENGRRNHVQKNDHVR